MDKISQEVRKLAANAKSLYKKIFRMCGVDRNAGEFSEITNYFTFKLYYMLFSDF